MKITKIEVQKKNSNRCSIYIDGEYHSSIDKDIQEELKLREGMELNEDEFNQKLEIIQNKSALRAALYIVARASKTESEIRKRLKEKQHNEKAISLALEYLREVGYINDESYTESFIRSSKDVTGTSKRTLYYKLANKGVDSEVIQQKLEEADIDDYASAMKAAQKKAASIKGDKRERASKLLSYLYRKGYGVDVCKKIIDTLDLEEN
ncbi:MAG TPA: RecX family transcriptional regulator [Clostridia bacterium]|nr:RecX family transcriptional regulator [Clostridia bacterium]